MSNRPKWYLGCAIFAGIIAIGLLALGIFSTAKLPGMLYDQAAQKSMLSRDSYQQWGQVPGEFDVFISRTYSFFNFTNPFDVFFFNDTPKFVQTKEYKYQEFQNLTNPVWSESDNVVDFGYQQYMLKDANATDPITTINLGPLGFWYTVQQLPDYQFATYTLGNLVSSLELDIPTTLQCSAIKFQCASTQDATNSFLTKSGISDQQVLDLIWNDPVNGLKDASTLPLWVHAIAGGPQSGSARILGDYFYLNSSQVNLLFRSNGELSTCVQGLNTSIKNAYNCSTNPCDPHYLVTLQLSSQGVTLHPAGGAVPPEDSVTYFNRTATGYPEITYFLNSYFIPKYNVSASDYNLTFPVDLASTLFNYTHSTGSMYNTDQNTLLHFGNLMFLYEVGAQFDQKGDITDLTLLEPIQTRFGLPSLQHAHVLYKYVQYIEAEFGEKRSLGGSKSELTIGQFASSGVYGGYLGVVDYLLDELTSRIVLKQITQFSGMDCQELLVSSTGSLMNATTADSICNSSKLSSFDKYSIQFLMTACEHQGGDEYNFMLNQLNFTKAELSIFCGSPESNTFIGIVQASQLLLKNHYNCSGSFTYSGRCSRREIAVLQWSSSVITQNPPITLADELKPGLSVNNWDNQRFPVPTEYYAVLNLLSRNLNESDIQPMDPVIANQLLTFDRLFSQTQIQDAFLFFEQKMWSEFNEAFFNVSAYPLVSYLRYIMIQLTLGGFAQTRTVDQLLWGYTDFLLQFIKGQDPTQSGDPSLTDFISLAGQNSSYEQAEDYHISMFTGKNDSSLTRRIISFFHKNIITFPDAYFNGNETVAVQTNPWSEEIPFTGTDGAINNPGLKTSDVIDLYISDINYQTKLGYNMTDVKNGLDTYRYTILPSALANKTNNKDNARWFADRWNGVMNISAIHKAPLMVCKGHFLDTDQVLYDAVVMCSDDNCTEKLKPSIDDDLFIDIEPYSGVAVGVQANLQINYELKQDKLITNPNYALLPIVLTSRDMSFSDDQMKNVFGQLKTGIGLKKSGPLIGFIGFGVFLVICIVLIVLRSKALKNGDAYVDYGSYHRADKPNPSVEQNEGPRYN